MVKRWLVVAVLTVLGVTAGPVRAVSPPPLPQGSEAEAALAKQLRNFILDALPDPLYEDAKHWGQQKRGPRGKMKNDGRWHKLRITARNPAQELTLDVKDLEKAPGRTAFTFVVTFPAVVLLERQTWAMGARLYSGSTRARVRVGLILICEVLTRVEKSKGWIPDMVLRFRVLQSAFNYTDLVVEHTAGVGGDAAKVLGDMMISLVKAAKPNLERDLKRKANEAILKAGDTKE